MSEKPTRIQRRRTKGWRMPPGAVYVGRGSRWGNKFIIAASGRADLDHYADYTKNVDLWDGWPLKDAATVVRAFREMQCTETFKRTARSALRGKNLCCWCASDAPCHADVLLEIANS